ncbi:MAG: DNA modification methylase [Candidatus Alkanophagales archaeon MCA70_species_2]|nr:DNA modification methylase [Candidatus Alkanophaga liquidiphilum]
MFTLEEYLKFLKIVWKEVYRALVPGGRACIYQHSKFRKEEPYVSLH